MPIVPFFPFFPAPQKVERDQRWRQNPSAGVQRHRSLPGPHRHGHVQHPHPYHIPRHNSQPHTASPLRHASSHSSLNSSVCSSVVRQPSGPQSPPHYLFSSAPSTAGSSVSSAGLLSTSTVSTSYFPPALQTTTTASSFSSPQGFPYQHQFQAHPPPQKPQPQQPRVYSFENSFQSTLEGQYSAPSNSRRSPSPKTKSPTTHSAPAANSMHSQI